jgi:hypothetical protein
VKSWPTNLIKSCPRCGNTKWDETDTATSLWIYGVRVGCWKCDHGEDFKSWNNRPVITALEDKVKRLQSACPKKLIDENNALRDSIAALKDFVEGKRNDCENISEILNGALKL